MPESRLRPPGLAPGGRKSRINTTQTLVSNRFQVGNRRNAQGIYAGAGYFNKFLGLSHDKGSEGVQGLFAHVACCV